MVQWYQCRLLSAYIILYYIYILYYFDILDEGQADAPSKSMLNMIMLVIIVLLTSPACSGFDRVNKETQLNCVNFIY